MKARSHCFQCGKRLTVHNGEEVFEVYTDPIGTQHKLHKICYDLEEYANKPLTACESDKLARITPE